MRSLVFFILFISTQSFATDHFVCATAQGTQDGTTPANCKTWSFADNEFAAGDTLYVIGNIDRATTFVFDDLGTSTSPITIRGDYTGAEPGVLSNSTNATATATLQLGTAGEPASYIIVRNLTIQNSSTTGPCILDSSLGAGGGFNQYISLNINHCGTYGLLVQKPNATVDSSTFSYCNDDCFGASSAGINVVIKNSTFSQFSYATTTGDAIFINTGQLLSDVTIQNNIIYWDNNNSTKQGFIGGVDTGTLRILNNSFIARTKTTANHAIAVEAAGDAFVSFNYCEGFRACVTHFSSGAQGIDSSLNVNNNVAIGSQYLAFITTTVGTPVVNVVGNICTDCAYRGIDASGAGTTLNVYNNYINTKSNTVSLYISNTIASFAGNNNNYYPEGTGFIQNYECGTTYATLNTYKAGCGTVEQASTSIVNPFPGALVSERTIRD